MTYDVDVPFSSSSETARQLGWLKNNGLKYGTNGDWTVHIRDNPVCWVYHFVSATSAYKFQVFLSESNDNN